MGFLNGLLTVKVGVPSIIATIGTQFFWRGRILLRSDGLAIPLEALRGSGLHTLRVGRLGPWEIPARSLRALAPGVGAALPLHRPPFGDALLFVGDNPRAASSLARRGRG